ncbi:hypothetical protein PG996_004430 [Apiospora saccharicola]|uniref:BTB domain-containing protein n=1 Tax=Apiospora saccharicola TaxID=335842 RepID=A0ABR1W6Y2_9PEZI
MESTGEGYTKVVLVEDGDLLIRVADTKFWGDKEYLVDSNAVKRSSKPLDVLVAEKRTDFRYDVVWIEDNVECFGILLSIMHCKFGEVPSELDDSDLYELLQVTEEYQVTHLLRPWAATWVEPYQDDFFLWLSDTDEELAMKGLGERLWIAWVLGEKRMFRKLTRYIIKEAPFNDYHELYFGEGNAFSLLEDPEIPGLLGYVRGEQLRRLQQLHEVFETVMERGSKYYNRYLGGERRPSDYYEAYDCCECGKHHIWGEFCQLCTRPENEQAMCNSVTLGSIIRGYRQHMAYLINHGYISISDDKETIASESINPGGAKMCLMYHLRGLRDIKIYGLPEAGGAQTTTVYGKTHGHCNPTAWIRAQLEDVLSGIAEDLGKELESSLDERARLSGMNNQLERAENESPKETKPTKRIKMTEEL